MQVGPTQPQEALEVERVPQLEAEGRLGDLKP